MDKSQLSANQDNAVVGVILAGGRSLRMGGEEKCLKHLGQTTLLDRVISTLSPQVPTLLLNANGDSGRFSTPLTVVPDTYEGWLGPLAGLASAMAWVKKHMPEVTYIVSAPADCPFLPNNLAKRLLAPLNDDTSAHYQAVIATSNERKHYITAAWSTSLFDSLDNYLKSGERAAGKFIQSLHTTYCHFDSSGIDPFFNINTPEDLERAKQYLESQGAQS